MTESAKAPVIELCNITKSYSARCGKVEALRGVSLKVERGEFVAVTGRSGSGKSTLMNIIGCLDVPDSGSYSLCGEEVKFLSERRLNELRRNYIGFVFQSFNLIPDLTAAENVELPMMYRRIPRSVRKKLAAEALDAVGLSIRSMHRPNELSGGQQQRVAIARAVAVRPGLLLADEPTGSLDSGSGEEVLELLRRLNREGVTILLITHDAGIAQKADRIITVCDGDVI